ncbi:related to PHO12 - secreted acid phosphatase [Cephalotrichum gorgonifer]|uniref:3-phytase n=1 Tax=Cephalotrichum gorgonifer TaxID=2041049 RepID=A0AAE8MPP0_9PEZI|nr:related to PHO12 - secreted acid phosphatase [Cephalotrichum gorgonifer]
MPSLSVCLGTCLALAGAVAAGGPRFLAPKQDIKLWRNKNAETSPLTWLGANGPWAAGPNVHGISTDVPDNCYVDQAAYVSRHGSRYPDKGAYGEWVEMESRFSAGGYTAEGALSFLPNWRPVLTNPDIQIAMVSPTGHKEAADMGYQLRTRYPQLYNDGDEFTIWANNYTRVLQTANSFMNGFLGASAPTLGNIIAVTGKGYAESLGNSLAPSDMCPNFKDASGGDYITQWNSIWQPQVQERLQKLITGNLTLTLSDVNLMPYLCGFESQITGRMSPFCDVFTEEELKMYQYSNDLRYYYGIGPGTDLPAKMMTPFLDSLIDHFVQGPGQEGVGLDGSSTFAVPKLLMSFLNDGQLNELITASGVFDEQEPLSATEKDDDRLWMGSRFTTMRGTIAFERLNCRVPSSESGNATVPVSAPIPTPTAGGRCKPSPPPYDGPTTNATFVRIRLNDQVYPVPSCQDGPGRSCGLEEYSAYVKAKYAEEGNWIANCNVTQPGAPTVVPGASFFTNLAQPHLAKFTLGA